MFDPLVELFIRALDDSNSTDVDPNDKTGNSTDTGADTNSGESLVDELMAYQKFGYVILAVVILFCLCCTWRCCKRRRDRRNLELDSARADNVLGDMAMVPTEELDEDAELI